MAQPPYGIAYGLGAGLNIAQDQFQRRQAQAMQMGLQELAMRKAQEEEAQRQALNEVMMTRVAPQMETPTQAQALQSVVGTGPQMGGTPTAGTGELPGIPQGGVPLAPGTVPQGPVPTLKQATAPREQRYTTPYQRMAYEFRQKAQMLADRGLGMSSMKLMEQATQAEQAHTESLGRNAATAIIRGSADAAERLADLGWAGVKNVGRRGDLFYVEDETGNMTTMDYNDLAALSAGSARLPDILQRIGSSENRMRSQQFTQEELTRRAKMNAEAALERARAKGEFDLAAKRIMATRPTGRASGSTSESAWIKNVKFVAESKVREAADNGVVISPEDAISEAMREVPVPGAGTRRETLTPSQRANILIKQIESMRSDDPRRAEKEKELEDIQQASKPSKKAEPQKGVQSLDEYLKSKGF